MTPAKNLILCFLIFTSLVFGSLAYADKKATQEIMWRLSDAIAYLLPFSVRESEFISTLDQSLLDKHLRDLRIGSNALREHATRKDEGFELLARSFDKITVDIETGFQGKWPAYSYYSLAELTQHCVACHSRLPGESVPMLGQKIMARIDTKDFDTWNLVNLLIATREFDSAMNLLERELLAPGTEPTELEYSGLFITYLRVAININKDVQRPVKVLGEFLNRNDIPHYLSFRVMKWREYLLALDPIFQQTPSLKNAKMLLKKGEQLTRVPGDSIRAVHDLMAYSMLQQLVDGEATSSDSERAEVFFNLGIIALRTLETNFSVPELEYLFIAAIKAEPGGPFAGPAYRYLEEFGYIEDEDAPPEAGPLVQRVVDLEQLRSDAGVGNP